MAYIGQVLKTEHHLSSLALNLPSHMLLNQVELEIPNLEEFDIYTNKWRSLPPIHNVRRGAAVAVADGKIYYIGGTPWREPPVGSLYFKVLDAVEIFCIKEEVCGYFSPTFYMSLMTYFHFVGRLLRIMYNIKIPQIHPIICHTL